MSDTVIRVENLGKKYIIGHQQQAGYLTLREEITKRFSLILNPFSKRVSHPAKEEFWALNDISFEIKQGEVIGIIGRNGAGKSTLLKLLSRITEPTCGRISLTGRVASLLEVGTGFHPELTGRENIFLNGAILGMSRREIVRKFDEIVAFSEVEKFLDTPVKRYSSGMYVRLAFAVAAHLEPEILVVDEVLAVGDAQFQKKCLGKMKDVSGEGRTVIFVSHNLGAVSQLCPNCLWLEQGKIQDYGATSLMVSSYLRSCDASSGTGQSIFKEDLEKDSQLRQVRLLTEERVVTQTFDCDEPVVVELVYQVRRRVPGLYCYLEISRIDGICVMVSDSFDMGDNPLSDLPPGMYCIKVSIPPRTLGHGDYTIYLNFASPAGNKFNIDSPDIVCTFTLNDFTTRRGNKRPGYFSTLANWDVSAVSSVPQITDRLF